MSATEALIELAAGRRICVLTGAGCSTESGIPDYRGPETRRRARNPIRFAQFVTDPEWRKRYWARAMVGWETIRLAKPNPAHRALARLEQSGGVTGLITQNVDGLHQAAGHQSVVELHGSLSWVVCLRCGARESRSSLQRRLKATNPDVVLPRVEGLAAAPDGDADVAVGREFRVVDCLQCRGPLKPDVVFFGENVPRARVERAHALVEEADLLLVVGSSLTVFSGYRFVRAASSRGQPVAIVNLGPTRGDEFAAVRVEGRAGVVLSKLANRWVPMVDADVHGRSNCV